MADEGYYRLYRFDRVGHIVGFKELNCRTDFDALEQARKLASSETQELWGCDKLVALIPPQHVA
jgi:hypothetical protein